MGRFRFPAASVLAVALLGALPGVAQDVNQSAPPAASPGGWRKFPVDPSVNPAPAPQAPPVSNYDKAIFQKPIPGDQLAFLKQFDGAPSNDLVRDKQFRKLMRSVLPSCIFHYGRDMALSDALDMVLKGSTLPVRIRDDRYLMVSGRSGPYLGGRDLYGLICRTASPWAGSISIQPMANPRPLSTFSPSK
jgi:hypothetical protein